MIPQLQRASRNDSYMGAAPSYRRVSASAHLTYKWLLLCNIDECRKRPTSEATIAYMTESDVRSYIGDRSEHIRRPLLRGSRGFHIACFYMRDSANLDRRVWWAWSLMTSGIWKTR